MDAVDDVQQVEAVAAQVPRDQLVELARRQVVRNLEVVEGVAEDEVEALAGGQERRRVRASSLWISSGASGRRAQVLRGRPVTAGSISATTIVPRVRCLDVARKGVPAAPEEERVDAVPGGCSFAIASA